MLALTDHDEIRGLDEAREAALGLGLQLVNGVEISVTWHGRTVHVVGLQIDPACVMLQNGLARLRAGRGERAARMAAELEQWGVPTCLDGAARYARNPELIGRAHFARYIVECGFAPNVKAVFDRFLVEGKPGFVPHLWTTLDAAVTWIREAGGTAVVAHPGRYRLSSPDLNTLLCEFRDLGGVAIEVVSPGHRPDELGTLAKLCRGLGLKGSVGSDFHGPGEQYLDLGRLPRLPSGVVPVWDDWDLARAALH